MKRRRAWNIFCAFSLLIFATSVTLWVRSYCFGLFGSWSTPSLLGGPTLAFMNFPHHSEIEIYTVYTYNVHGTYLCEIPYWPFLIFAVPPLVWWRQRRKRRPLSGGRGFPLAAEASQPDLNGHSS